MNYNGIKLQLDGENKKEKDYDGILSSKYMCATQTDV